jgi:homoserine dehydrogenase
MVVTSAGLAEMWCFSGHGAGGEPTAVAVVSDILAVAQGSVAVSLPVRRRQVTSEFLAPHYLRFIVDDKPGIVSGIAGALAKVGANIDSLLQRPGYPKHRLPFVVTTEPGLGATIETRRRGDRKDGLHAGAAAVLADTHVGREGRVAMP